MLIQSNTAKPANGGRRRRRLMFAAACLAAAGAIFLAGAYAQWRGMLRPIYDSLAGAPGRARAHWAAPQPPTLVVDMKFRDFLKVRAKREEALQRGVLLSSQADLVPATVRMGDSQGAVEMRLKGDWVDHLETDKWSYRIDVKDDFRLDGMRTFSIQHPMTRNYEAEWLFHKVLRQEGLLGLRYSFIRVSGMSRGASP